MLHIFCCYLFPKSHSHLSSCFTRLAFEWTSTGANSACILQIECYFAAWMHKVLETSKCTIHRQKCRGLDTLVVWIVNEFLAMSFAGIHLQCIGFQFLLLGLEHSMTTLSARGHLAAGKAQHSTDKNKYQNTEIISSTESSFHATCDMPLQLRYAASLHCEKYSCQATESRWRCCPGPSEMLLDRISEAMAVSAPLLQDLQELLWAAPVQCLAGQDFP